MSTAAGLPLVDFADFVNATGIRMIRGPKQTLSDAVQNRYFIGRLMGGGWTEQKHLRGGESINTDIKFKTSLTSEEYQPGQFHNWKNPQRRHRVTSRYRYVMTHFSWTDQEIEQNELITEGDERMLAQQYAHMRDSKMQDCETDKWAFLDQQVFAVPDKTKMESASGISPYSIWAHVNEDANGLFGENWTGNTWTTVEGLDPTQASVNGRWQPQKVTYNGTAINQKVADGTKRNIIEAFDLIFKKLQFFKPHARPSEERYFTEDTGRGGNQVIITSLEGSTIYEALLRASNDRLRIAQDPAYPGPQYYMIPVEWQPGFDAAVYDDGSNGLATQFAATNKGPRYMFLNGRWLYPVFHKYRVMRRLKESTQHNVPDTHVIPITTWWNLHCESRWRQGIVSPVGSMYTS